MQATSSTSYKLQATSYKLQVTSGSQLTNLFVQADVDANDLIDWNELAQLLHERQLVPFDPRAEQEYREKAKRAAAVACNM